MTKPKVAAALIVKAGDDSEAAHLSRALGSINGYVDEIFILLNAPKGTAVSPVMRQIAERFTKEIKTHVWTGNYVAARTANFKQVPKKYDWIFWMDTDDTVDNPEQIQQIAAIMPKDVNGVMIMYDYAHDEYGNLTTSLLTNRLVRNNGTFAWKSSIDDDEISVHEALTAVLSARSVYNNDFKVIHHADGQKQAQSLLRNIELLEGMYERHSAKGIVDPRILFYLATHYYDGLNYDRCLELLVEYLRLSGWSEERSDANYYIGNILATRGNTATARKAYLEALGENNNNVKAYIGLAQVDFKMQRYDQAAEWLEKAAGLKRGVTKIVQHNDDYELNRLLAQTYLNLGGRKLNDALVYANKALKLRPFDELAKEHRDVIANVIKHRDDTKAAFRLIKRLEDDKAAVLPLLDALPRDLTDTVVVQDAYQRHTPPRVWPKKSVAIYVGQSPLGIWGPWSITEGGTGGSEEAVIRLAPLLVKLGWQVTVFGCPGERAGTYDGVDWKQYWEINAKDSFDVLISWRAVHFFDYKFKARKSYVWLHDIVPKEEFTKDRIKHFDKAIFVSKYHSERPEFAAIPAAKRFVSGNGISPADFAKLDGKLKRDTQRCIYMSANERGLRVLLDVWPDVKKAVSGATLDVYYGWHSFDAINRDNPERMAWKALMQQRMKELSGVTERGRVGQDVLNEEIFKSGIFAYPCTFPEVNCITAQKSMAGGAIPVTSDFAVLDDIIQYGDKVAMHDFQDADIERYKQHLIAMLQNPEKQEAIRPKMMGWARQEFDWETTAAGWDQEMVT